MCIIQKYILCDFDFKSSEFQFHVSFIKKIVSFFDQVYFKSILLMQKGG